MRNDILIEVENIAKNFLKTTWFINGNSFNLSSSGWSFAFHNRKETLGTCKYKNKTIYLSKHLILLNPDTKIWVDTIKHEIAHAIDYVIRGTSDHGLKWKHIATQVGCNPMRCHEARLESQPKYKYVCNNCNKIVRRHRRTIAACGKCCKTHNNGRFTDKYLLVLSNN